MDGIFLKIFNMSVTAAWLALAVIVLRFLLRRAPRWITVAMWALVGVRLLCPFSFESVLSLVPSAETVPADIIYAKTPAINSGVYIINSAVNPVLQDSFTPTELGASVNPIQIFLFLVEVIWIVGMAGMLIYTLVSYLLIHRKVREAAPLEGNVWLCDRIASPFIFGVIRPRIYLPSDMSEADVEYVLAHERAHLARRDHWWKPLGFLLLTVHWFNPIMWVAYILLCRDIEIACDEKVIAKMGTEIKKPYSDALINASVSRKTIAACPLAFGEVGVKTRIKSVLNYKKPAFWVIVVALILSVALAVAFLTDPASVDRDLQAFLDEQVIAHNESIHTGGNAQCVSTEILGVEKKGDEITVYLWAMYEEYILGVNGELILGCGSHISTVVTAKKTDDGYGLVEYWTPRDGTYWAKDIRDKFPMRLWLKATDSQRYVDRQTAECEKEAREYFESKGNVVLGPDEHILGGITVIGSGSELDGVSVEITDLALGGDSSHLSLAWINTRADDVMYGEEFYVCRFVDGEWVDCRTYSPYIWHDIGYFCLAGGTSSYDYGLSKIDLSQPGVYRFETNCHIIGGEFKNYLVWVEFKLAGEILTPETESEIKYDPSDTEYINSLRKKYPRYFDLDTSKGLEVYWYQMSEGLYSWILLPGRDTPYTWTDGIDLPPATTGEMRTIVESYGLPRTEISVEYMGMPHSSYLVPSSPEYFERVRAMFWLSFPVAGSAYTVPSYGSLVFDIDDDGFDEIVSLGMGITSGVFSFSMTASYNGVQEYRDYFTSPWCEPQFLVRHDGSVKLLIKPNDEDYKAVTYEISVVDGHIVLTADEEAEEYANVKRLSLPEEE